MSTGFDRVSRSFWLGTLLNIVGAISNEAELDGRYGEREEAMGSERMRMLERFLLLCGQGFKLPAYTLRCSELNQSSVGCRLLHLVVDIFRTKSQRILALLFSIPVDSGVSRNGVDPGRC